MKNSTTLPTGILIMLFALVAMSSGSMAALVDNSGTYVGTATQKSTVADLLLSGDACYTLMDINRTPQMTTAHVSLMTNKHNPIKGFSTSYVTGDILSSEMWSEFLQDRLGIPMDRVRVEVKETSLSAGFPVAVSFVMDYSSSMTVPRLIKMQQAVSNILKTLNEGDMASVVRFSSTIRKDVELSSNTEYLESAFGSIPARTMRGNGTAVHDAIIVALSELEKAPEGYTKCVFVFTDGEDNASASPLSNVVIKAGEVNAKIFAIAGGASAVGNMRSAVSETGGSLFYIRDAGSFEQTLSGIYRALHHHYTITVRPHDNDVYSSHITTWNEKSSVEELLGADMASAMADRKFRIANAQATDGELTLNTALNLGHGTGDIDPADAAFIDAVATSLVQQSSLTVQITTKSDRSMQNTNRAVVDAEQIRKELLRRGVNSNQIGIVSGSTGIGNASKSDSHNTTLSFSKK